METNPAVVATQAVRGGASQRGLRLGERLLSTAAEIGIERERYYTTKCQKMAEDRSCLRAARALEDRLRLVLIWLEDDDLLRQAFAVQLSFCIDQCLQAAGLEDRVYGEHFPADV